MDTLAQAMARYSVHNAKALAGRLGIDDRQSFAVSDLLRGADTLIYTPGRELNAGDVVTRDLNVQLWSDGRWRFWGRVFDHGTFSGDDFEVVATVSGATDIVAPYFRFHGHVGRQTENKWDQSGVELKISAVWSRLKKAGRVNWRLHNSWGLDTDDVLGALFIGSVVASPFLLVNGPAAGGPGNNSTHGPDDLR